MFAVVVSSFKMSCPRSDKLGQIRIHPGYEKIIPTSGLGGYSGPSGWFEALGSKPNLSDTRKERGAGM